MAVALMSVECTTIDSSRIPSYVVYIKLNTAALWQIYGVSGVGDYTVFNKEKKLPSNYSYTATTYTGFGGVLLMCGYSSSTQTYGAPVAYDMACPVECSKDVVVSYDSNTFEAYCPKCGSHYNVLEGDGAAVSGTAAEKNYGLTRYTVYAENGGYIITN